MEKDPFDLSDEEEETEPEEIEEPTPSEQPDNVPDLMSREPGNYNDDSDDDSDYEPDEDDDEDAEPEDKSPMDHPPLKDLPEVETVDDEEDLPEHLK